MSKPISNYYNTEKTSEAIEQGRHRAWVGGLWEEIGQLQVKFLCKQGLRSDMKLLDVGCGCFRGGVHLVEYLDAGCYYGMDISQELLDTGYEKEIRPLGLDCKLPRANLLCDGEFRAERLGVKFDIGIAQSVFTHLPTNHIKLCLTRLAPVFVPGGVFYATAFICKDGEDWTQSIPRANNLIKTHPTEDPFHYELTDLARLADGSAWTFDYVGEWGHPRGQTMLKFTRLADKAAI